MKIIFGIITEASNTAYLIPPFQVLEDNLIYCQDVLNLVSKLDPGLTPQFAFLLKATAMTRAELVKVLKSSYPEDENVLLRCKELSRKAMTEFRMGAMCMNPPKKGIDKLIQNGK